MKKTKSAGGVVLNKNRDILIVNQRGNSWSLPKGHVEIGEELLETAKREIYEESGIKDLTYVIKLGYYSRFRIGLDLKDDQSELKEIHMFLFKTDETNLNPIDDHNPEAKWILPGNVSGYLTHKKDKLFFEEIKKKFLSD